MRESVVFYKSWADALSILPPEEYKETVQAILSYAMEDVDPDIRGVGYSLFIMAKPTIDSNNKKYSKGKTGGRPKTNGYENEKPMVSENENHRFSKEKPTDTVTDTVTVSVSDTAYSDEFERVWRAYPRKKEKQRAFKAYQSRRKEYSADQLMLAVQRYANECMIEETEAKYIKHGATFFGPACPFTDYLAKDYAPPKKTSGNAFHNFEERTYDYPALERALSRKKVGK